MVGGPFVFGIVVGVALSTAYWMYKEYRRTQRAQSHHSQHSEPAGGGSDMNLKSRPPDGETNTTTGTIQDCAFCLEPCLGENILRLYVSQSVSCGHQFHKTCALPWLQRNSTCPVCRQHVCSWQEARVRRL